jgi:hypothetical protein
MTYRSSTALVITLFSLLFASPVSAQERPEGPFYFKLDGGGVHQSENDLTDSGGGFSIDRWFVSAGVDYAWDQRTSLGVSLGGGVSDYDFTDLTGIGNGEPWDKINETRISATWRFGFSETGSMIIIPTMRLNGESDASSSDSSTYGLFAAATWRISEDLTIGPGIGVFSRLESGSTVFPILAIDWNISDRWNLSTGRGLAASQGPGLTLSYQLNEDWSLGLAGRYEDIEFRLDNSGVAAGGVGRDQSIPLVFTADLKASQKLSLSVFAGLELGGTLKIQDAMGETIEESDYDPAPLFGASFEFRF